MEVSFKIHAIIISQFVFQGAFKVEYKNEARLLYGITSVRHRSTSPLNTIVMFVPQQEVSK